MKERAVYQNVFTNNMYPAIVTEAKNQMYQNIIYCHWHEAIEFIYVSMGTLALRIDMDEFIIQEGELAMVNSSQVHFANVANEHNCTVYAIVFNLELLSFSDDNTSQNKFIEPLIQGMFKFPAHITYDTPWGKRILSSVRKIIELDKRPMNNELFLKSYLYNIIAELYSAEAFIKNDSMLVSNPKLERLKKIMEFIHCHYQEKLYIADLANQLHMSEDNLYKYFKKSTGRTPTEYINLYRIHVAEQLLIKDNLSISDISFSVGFENISYFIRTFKKYHGCTPKQYQIRGEKAHP